MLEIPWKFEASSARNDEGTHKNLPCVLMDLTLKSAADFMEDHKHFLDGWRGTFTQTLALVFLGRKADRKKKRLGGLYIFCQLKLNHVFA